MQKIELQKLDYKLSLCKLSDVGMVDFTRELVFLSRTPDEISLVCESDYVPPNFIEMEEGWRALRVAGVLDFELIGIVANISRILAEAEISVFVVSTYNTDYILMKEEKFEAGVQALVRGGYALCGAGA